MPKTTADKLNAAVSKILQEYAEDTTMTVKDLSKQFTKKGAQAVRSASAESYGAGRYSKGWTSTFEEDRLSAKGVIYNKTPGLPHLLEHGHAKRGGGRVPGRSHVAPVEEKLTEDFLKAVKDKI